MSFKERFAVWWKKLKEKYHLSVVNKDSFVEVYSFQFSKAGFYGVILGFVFLISFITFTIIATTPLKRFVPGYESDDVHRKLIHLYNKVILLEDEVDGKTEYAMITDSILRNVGINPDSINWDEFEVVEKNSPEKKVLPEFYLDKVKKSNKSITHFFYKPVNGKVVKNFEPEDDFFGVDIVCQTSESVKSILPGRVILTSGNNESGFLVIIKHSNDLLSVYKYNSLLLKKEGEAVNAGEAIAVVGNKKDNCNLHFQIWFKQNCLNPEDLIHFNRF